MSKLEEAAEDRELGRKVRAMVRTHYMDTLTELFAKYPEHTATRNLLDPRSKEILGEETWARLYGEKFSD